MVPHAPATTADSLRSRESVAAAPEPKGLPSDLSDLARMEIDSWAADGHSHSWLPLQVAAAVWRATEYSPSDHAPNNPEWFFFGVETEHIEESRVVFWFDN